MYFWLSFLLYLLQWIPSFDAVYSDYDIVPFWFRLCWFSYDVSLVGSCVSLPLFFMLTENPYEKDTEEHEIFRVGNENALICYCLNLSGMVITALIGRMVLIPNHIWNVTLLWLSYVIFNTVFIYTDEVRSLVSVPQYFSLLIRAIVLTWFFYIILSTLTMARFKLTNTEPNYVIWETYF
jgi:hypothetical protein